MKEESRIDFIIYLTKSLVFYNILVSFMLEITKEEKKIKIRNLTFSSTKIRKTLTGTKIIFINFLFIYQIQFAVKYN